MSSSHPVESRLNMRNLHVLLVEHNRQEQDIVVQILLGFGVRAVARRCTAAEAKTHVQHDPPDLLIVDAALPKTDGYDFTRWMRTTKALRCREVPLILLTVHTKAADVVRARNCGASLVIAKPVTSRILFERIAWLARNERSFVERDAYTGPDRRFKMVGPPPDTSGRRSDDLSLAVGEATSGNMSQAEIDALLNPRGAVR